MWNLIKSKFFFYIIHKVNEFYKISIVVLIYSFNKTNKKLMLGINVF